MTSGPERHTLEIRVEQRGLLGLPFKGSRLLFFGTARIGAGMDKAAGMRDAYLTRIDTPARVSQLGPSCSPRIT